MYNVEGNILIFANGTRHPFDCEIAEVLDFEDVLVVRLANSTIPNNENVYGMDFSGNVLWRIPSRPQMQGLSPYVGLWRKDTIYLEAFNWNGYSVLMDPKKGTILTESLTQAGAPSTKRGPSRRNWI